MSPDQVAQAHLDLLAKESHPKRLSDLAIRTASNPCGILKVTDNDLENHKTIRILRPRMDSSSLFKIVFLVSDGDSSKCPPTGVHELDGTEENISHGWSVLANDSSVKTKWLASLGHELASDLSLAKGRLEKWVLADFPAGYQLFDYVKESSHTPYLWGYPTNVIQKFRTPNDFLPHLKWLASQDNNKEKCACKCCKKSTAIGLKIGQVTSILTECEPTAKKVKKEVRSDKLANVPSIKPKEHDRLSNYRLHELVWCELSQEDLKVRLGTKYWPGICQKMEIVVETCEVFDISSFDPSVDSKHAIRPCCSASHANVSVDPVQPQKELRKTHSWNIQLLGVSNTLRRRESQILPWLYQPLDEADWDTVSTGKIPVPDFLVDETQPLPPLAALTNPVIARLVFQLAVQISAHIEETWSPCDQYSRGLEYLPDLKKLRKHILKNCPQKCVARKRTQLNAIWLGAERVRTNDLVRLRGIETLTVPLGSLDSPSENQVYFFKIDFFWRNTESGSVVAGGKMFRLLGLSQGSSPTSQSHTASFDPKDSRLSAGDRYLSKCADPIPDTQDVLSSKEVPPPPKGFRFLCLTPRQKIHHIEVECIAGRYYSPKVGHDELGRLRNQLASKHKNRALNSDSTSAVNDKLAGLLGFKDGMANFMKFYKMRSSREKMVYAAYKTSKELMSSHFVVKSVPEKSSNLLKKVPTIEIS